MSWYYRCDRCGRKSRILDVVDIRHYNVCTRGDDFDFCEEVLCMSTVGWCRRCNDVRKIELVPPLEQLRQFKDQLVQDLQSATENDARIQGGRKVESLEDMIETADALIRWREKRVSPAKCFSCASTLVKPIPSVEDFFHPGCGGKFVTVEGGYEGWDEFPGDYPAYPAEGPEYHPPTLVGFFRDFFCPMIRDMFS